MKDPIERQDAIDAVKCGALSAAMVYGRTDAGRTALSETVKAIKAIPSVQPETVKRTEESAQNVPNDDLISRKAAIDALYHWEMCYTWDEHCRDDRDLPYIVSPSKLIDGLPSAQPDYIMTEWCTDCKEYDQERHCCPRFNRVIRTALQDAQPEIVRCKNCKHGMYDMMCKFYWCHGVAHSANWYCADAERITNDLQ